MLYLTLFDELERAKGFEPSTPTLARLCSTPELHPHSPAFFRPPGIFVCQIKPILATDSTPFGYREAAGYGEPTALYRWRCDFRISSLEFRIPALIDIHSHACQFCRPLRFSRSARHFLSYRRASAPLYRRSVAIAARANPRRPYQESFSQGQDRCALSRCGLGGRGDRPQGAAEHFGRGPVLIRISRPVA